MTFKIEKKAKTKKPSLTYNYPSLVSSDSQLIQTVNCNSISTIVLILGLSGPDPRPSTPETAKQSWPLMQEQVLWKIDRQPERTDVWGDVGVPVKQMTGWTTGWHVCPPLLF